MADNKNMDQIWPEWNWEINLNDLNASKLTWWSNETLDDIANNSEEWSIIWRINDNNNWDDYTDVDLRTSWKSLIKSNNLWTSKHTKIITLSIIAIIITSLVWFIFYKYDKYILDYWNWIENTTDKVVTFYENAKERIYKTIWKEYKKSGSSIDLIGINWKRELTNLIQSDQWYIYKKETIKNSMPSFLNSVVENASKVDETKKQITENWFFSSELSEIITKDESITSIQDSLTAIEAIKFNSAITVFSKLDTFVDSLSKEIWMSKEEIIKNMENITNRWEKDINLYIKNCQLNTFETNSDCNNVWDFDKYYELTEDTEFNTKFFKTLIQFIDDKLEQSEIPSFSIKFQSYNKQNNELTFEIEINTFKEDEEEFAKKWILSPHSFMLNCLVNNLKLSRAIISETIETKTIKITNEKIEIWDTVFVVNKSKKTFTVPIKNENQIEIDDFIY